MKDEAIYNSSSQEDKISAIETIADEFGVDVDVYLDNKDLPKGVRKNARGWFDTKTGKVNVVLSNCKNVDIVADVVLHEAAGHKGLRALFGEDFETAMQNVYSNATEGIRATIDKWVNEGRVKDAIEGAEEYISRIGTSGPATEEELSLWQKIRTWLVSMLRKAGIKLRKLTDEDMRALFYESMNALKKQKSPIKQAEVTVMREEYKEAAIRSHEEGDGEGGPDDNGGGKGSDIVYNLNSELKNAPTRFIPKDEYGEFMSIVRTEHYANFKGRRFCTIAIGNKEYGFVNYGFDKYRIIFVGDVSNFSRERRLKLDDLNAAGQFRNVRDVREHVTSLGGYEIGPDGGVYDGGEGFGYASSDEMDVRYDADDRRSPAGVLEDLQQDAEYLKAVKSGNIEKAQAMVDAKADAVLGTILLPDDTEEVGYKYHRGEAPKKVRTMYAVFNVNPDGFHAVYAGNASATPVGVWLDAQNLKSYESSTVKFDDGTPATYIPGDTGKSTKVAGINPEERGPEAIGKSWLLERGGKHGSDVPNFSQMNLGVNEKGEKVSSPVTNGALPHNKLVFEIECGMSEDGDLTEYVKENGRMMKGKNQGLTCIIHSYHRPTVFRSYFGHIFFWSHTDFASMSA